MTETTTTNNRTVSKLQSTVRSEQAVFAFAISSLIIAWHIGANVLGHASSISSPQLVWAYTIELLVSMEWTHHMFLTVRRAAIAFVISTVVGILLALVMGYSPFWERVFMDYVILGLSIPSLLMVVFAAMWFGIGGLTPIAAASLLLIPYNAQLVYEGIKNLDQDLLEMARSFSVSRPRLTWRVVLRSLLPSIVAAWRISLSAGWKVISLSEFLAAESGFGFIIREQYQSASLTGVIGWSLLFVAIILFVEYGLFRLFERRVFAYRDDVATSMG